MRCSNEYNPNVISASHLGTNKLFTLLSVPQDEREDFISQSHEVNGQTKTVDEMTTRELQKVIFFKLNYILFIYLAISKASKTQECGFKVCEN